MQAVLTIQVAEYSSVLERLFEPMFKFAKKLSRRGRAAVRKKIKSEKEIEANEASAGNSPPTLGISVGDNIDVKLRFGG